MALTASQADGSNTIEVALNGFLGATGEDFDAPILLALAAVLVGLRTFERITMNAANIAIKKRTKAMIFIFIPEVIPHD